MCIHFHSFMPSLSVSLCQSQMHDCVVLGHFFNFKFLHESNGWILKIPHRLKNVCEFFIILKVLHHLKLFYRRFFDNKYKVSYVHLTLTSVSFLGLEEAERKGERSFFLSIRKIHFKPFQTEPYFASFLLVQPALLI